MPAPPRHRRRWRAAAALLRVALVSTPSASADDTTPAPAETPLDPAPSDGVASDAALSPEEEAALAAALEEPEAEPIAEVVVKATPSEARRRVESAEAVQVVDTRHARQQTGDLGERLARAPGVGIRRTGGLGSEAIVSLNGLQGDQVRLFLDGVPLHLAGYSFGLVNIPVNLVERVEVYRGVVPVRFGADALGGAINVVTDTREETQAGASYQVGSFGTVRATVNGRYRHEPSGVLLGATGFFDSTRNDYWMDDRPLPTPDGGTIYRSVRRFHDAYRAYGANLEAGVVDRPWARRLMLNVFLTSFYKELQHNSVMSVPYGEVTYGDSMHGVSARYDGELAPGLELSLLANLAFLDMSFRDMATHVYRWTGEPGRAVGRTGARGELRGEAIDQSVYQRSFYGRAGLAWTLPNRHVLRASLTPQVVWRTGDDHVPDRVDLLGLEDSVVQLVGGAEYQVGSSDEAWENVAFAKAYFMHASHEQRTTGIAPVVLEQERDMYNWGVGDALRYRLSDALIAKVSYEYATRLPRPSELFGDGALVESNTTLLPEQSHNLNVGPRVELRRTGYGDFSVDLNAFLRETRDQIVLLGGRAFIPYANISDTRGLGLEGALGWVAPGGWLELDATLTWQDVRNTSSDGPFAAMQGMRIPSRPYLFASWGLRFRYATPPFALEPFYQGRYTHGFDRGWAIGDPEFKISLPAQLNHQAGVSYTLTSGYGQLGCTFEVDNLANATLFDTFGVQRPGRSVALKVTGQL